MRGILLIAIICLPSWVFARTFYVQDKAYNEDASDLNPGTDINFPWATWQRAFNGATAGDTVYFRGGTWFPTYDNYGSVTEHHPAINRGHYGTYSKPICFFAYPPDVAVGNMPVLDCVNTHPSVSNHIGLRISDARYVKFRGLSIKNVRAWERASGEMWCAGILATDCENLTLEQMTVSYTGGPGYFLKGHDTLYVINCDAHHNCDSLDLELPGNDGDGFNIQAMGERSDTFRITYIHGCRAWNNSDDGFDIGSHMQLDVHDCWSWNNGYLQGDATGYKLCSSLLQTASKRRVYNCISAFNEGGGFVDLNLNDDIGPFMQYYNNTAYKCGEGFGSEVGNMFDCSLHPASVIYRNNLSYASEGYPAGFSACDYGYPTYVIQDHNTWVQTGEYWYTRANSDYQVTDDDFISLDSAQLRWPRKADGSLPDIDFLRLKATSDLVDRGVDVGLAYKGDAPDLGALEYGNLSVELISPVMNSRFKKGNEIAIQARVRDIFNEIREVDFYVQDVDKKLLGKGEQTEPGVWQFTWTGDAVGYFGLLATAVNTADETAVSSVVKILIYPYDVSENDSICQIIPNPNDGVFVLQLNEPLSSNSELLIVTMEGKTQAIETMVENEIVKTFDLSRLKAGAYGIVFQNKEGYQPCQPIKLIKN